MKAYRYLRAAPILALAVSFATVTAARTDTFGDIVREGQASAEAAQDSQRRIDQTAEAARALLHEYTGTVRQTRNLRAYNGRLERQIAEQERRIAAIDRSIADTTGFQRDLLPLAARIIEALDRFVALDLPFHLASRKARVAELDALLDDPRVPTADKYRRAMDALRAEIDYGSTIDSYRDRIALDKTEYEVIVLRVGRLALLARSLDGETLARWDRATGSWMELDGDYASTFDDGLRVAAGKLPADLLRLPLPAAAGSAK